jgi:hypothetical protein
MPSYFIQNRTNQRLYVPPPVNKTFSPNGNASVYVAAAEMEVAAIRNMVASGLISVAASDNQRLSDDLEVPVLSMIHGGGGGVASVSGLAPISSSGGANPIISLSGVVSPSHGGTGLNSPGSAGNVLTSDGAGGWTSSNPSTAHEQFDTLVHDLSESNFQEVAYASGFVSAVTYWTSAAKTLKIREALFNYTVDDLISSVVERQFDSAGAQVQQLVHTYSYNPDETLASITSVRT